MVKRRGRPRRRTTEKAAEPAVEEELTAAEVEDTQLTVVDKETLLRYLRRTEIEYVNQFAYNAFMRLIAAVRDDKLAPVVKD